MCWTRPPCAASWTTSGACSRCCRWRRWIDCGAASLPDHAAVITFDDGTQNLLTQAAPILRDLGLPAAVFLATGPMGSAETLWPDRLWLAFARTELPEADLTVLDLGRHPLGDDAQRGAAYAAAVHRLKELPDAERADRLETLLAALGPT